jgi:aminodeoxyfutalosine synthase
MDAGLRSDLEAKVYDGARLTRADAEALSGSDDLAWLGRLAHHRRTTGNGDRVLFAVNRHLDLTHACPVSCAYCAFRRDTGDARPVSLADAVRRGAELADPQLAELHLVNALHSPLDWRYYPRAVRDLKAALPDVSLMCFTATDVLRFEEISGQPAGAVLDELVDAGLESLTAGGDEVFDDEWARIQRLAHGRGMRTAAALPYGNNQAFGNDQEPRQRLDHLLRLRELQDETGGFAVLVPVQQQLDDHTLMAAPAESLKTFAVSRLIFDNVPHVKSLWAIHGPSVAQLTLNFGADDLDGSVSEVAHPHALAGEDLLELIRDAGFTPAERNARYDVVREHDGPVPLAERRSEPQKVWA